MPAFKFFVAILNFGAENLNWELSKSVQNRELFLLAFFSPQAGSGPVKGVKGSGTVMTKIPGMDKEIKSFFDGIFDKNYIKYTIST